MSKSQNTGQLRKLMAAVLGIALVAGAVFLAAAVDSSGAEQAAPEEPTGYSRALDPIADRRSPGKGHPSNDLFPGFAAPGVEAEDNIPDLIDSWMAAANRQVAAIEELDTEVTGPNTGLFDSWMAGRVAGTAAATATVPLTIDEALEAVRDFGGTDNDPELDRRVRDLRNLVEANTSSDAEAARVMSELFARDDIEAAQAEVARLSSLEARGAIGSNDPRLDEAVRELRELVAQQTASDDERDETMRGLLTDVVEWPSNPWWVEQYLYVADQEIVAEPASAPEVGGGTVDRTTIPEWLEPYLFEADLVLAAEQATDEVPPTIDRTTIPESLEPYMAFDDDVEPVEDEVAGIFIDFSVLHPDANVIRY